jgi:SAM-dependent methyltransferase
MAKKLLSRLLHGNRIKRLYNKKGYLDAYSEHTDIRVERDPHSAVGGMWEVTGRLQFDFLVNNGLKPHHRLLDIGCGTLRGGRHFIQYLNPRNYSGIDISPKAIEYGQKLVEQEGLSDKKPRLLVSRNKDLKFKEFDGEVFDYVLAQSVFTHLKPEHVEECFQHIGRIMKQESVFFFTYNEAGEFIQTGLKDFRYPFSFFQSLAEKYGFDLKDRSKDYEHPRGQHMAMLSKGEIARPKSPKDPA